MLLFFKAIKDWIRQKVAGDRSLSQGALGIFFEGNSVQRMQEIVNKSAHNDIEGVVSEALRVAELIYEYGLRGTPVHCHLVEGKIQMYIDNPGGGGGMPVGGSDVVVQLFKKAA